MPVVHDQRRLREHVAQGRRERRGRVDRDDLGAVPELLALQVKPPAGAGAAGAPGLPALEQTAAQTATRRDYQRLSLFSSDCGRTPGWSCLGPPGTSEAPPTGLEQGQQAARVGRVEVDELVIHGSVRRQPGSASNQRTDRAGSHRPPASAPRLPAVPMTRPARPARC